MMNTTKTSAATLANWLVDARQHTLLLCAGFDGDLWLGPKLDIVNPPLWEIGHLAWFQEHWCLRYCGADRDLLPSILSGADQLYNSAMVAHNTRWTLPLPDVANTRSYLRNVTDLVLQRLQTAPDNETLRYFAELSVYHEDMHGEALMYTRHTHGYSAPTPSPRFQVFAGPMPRGDVEFAGGQFLLGADASNKDFVFDNEKWAHEIFVAPFAMAKTAVSNAEFLAFVEADGYARHEFWSDAGWVWREHANAHHPLYWQCRDGEWFIREFDHWLPLTERADAAIIFVNWFEAEAYCRFAKRRLPTEAEWEFAASGTEKRKQPWIENGNAPGAAPRANLDGICARSQSVKAFPGSDSPEGVRQLWGNVWEWCADWFAPYPGYVRDPYKEYSEPWFGDHKVLRGGCWATRSRLLRNTWRNFYTPNRRDVFSGFRTCALRS